MVINLVENKESEIPVTINDSESNNDENKSELDLFNDKSEKKLNDDMTVAKLENLLSAEKQKTSIYEEKFKHAIADFQNLERTTKDTVENRINEKINVFILDFLQIYDDLVRAKDVAIDNKIVADGLDSILKNMNSLLLKYNIISINPVGEIFNPNFHEAIATVKDDLLDDDTITNVIRKGYISHQMVIRPALVEISKKLKSG